MSEPERLRLMAALAHPDDEAAGIGSAFAYSGRSGVQTALLMATRAERGWRGPPQDDPGPQAMAELRTGELEAVPAILGIEEIAYLGCMDGHLD